jgi:trehalose/maltose hydrolase-like predicted phosphorylase
MSRRAGASGVRRTSGVLRFATAVTLVALAASLSVPARGASQRPASPGADQVWTLSTKDFSSGYAPTFLGNGYLGERIPAAGMGYSASPVSTDTELAGFFGRVPGYVEQRAGIPTWSTLAFSDGSGTYGSLPGSAGQGSAGWQGSVRGWRQTLDLRRGVLTTAAAWRSPAGRMTDLVYDVVTDQARPHVAAVRLVLTPRWSGTARVTSVFDPTDTNLRVSGATASDLVVNTAAGLAEGTDTQLTVSTPAAGGPGRVESEAVTAIGTGETAGLAASLDLPVGATVTPAVFAAPPSVGQEASFPVTAGRSYTVTKFVGVRSSNDGAHPVVSARSDAVGAAKLGFAAILAEHEGAWASLWRTDIEVAGSPALQQAARAGLFYLLESTRAGATWSLSPAGLSSAGYNGHVFWDAETWMYPALLATHPDIAAGINRYRLDRLSQAEKYAVASGYHGARFPWESATTGDEQTPVFANTPIQLPGGVFPDTGRFEQHITADIALAQWQYYLATGDRRWLAQQGWPVLEAAATFWASRAVPDPSGGFDINHVMGPDEYHGDVANSAYSNVAAATSLRIASEAARLIGRPADPRWAKIADGLVLTVPFDPKRGIHLEYDGYAGETIKQADVVMLQYPWGATMPTRVSAADLAFYTAHTDPNGPSMTDAVDAIDTAALGTAGCADDWFLQRSVDPFLRAPFAQFAETRTGGAFTFLTGVGGFLQELLYGFSGMRFSEDSILIAPTLPPQLGGLTLRNLSWQGRLFTLVIGPSTTTVTLNSGAALPVTVGGVTRLIGAGANLAVGTRRPDLAPTPDLARCRPVTASSADPSYPPVGAVDGDPSTGWRAKSPEAWLQVDLGSQRRISRIAVRWGGAPPTGFAVAVSSDSHHWIETGAGGSISSAMTARFVRVTIRGSAKAPPAEVDSLEIDGR